MVNQVIPKRRKKLLFGKLKKHLGEVLHDLANQKENKPPALPEII